MSDGRKILPATPRQVITPLFSILRKDIPSIATVVKKEFDRLNKRRPTKPLIVADQTTWEISGQKLYDELSGMSKTIDYHLVDSNSYGHVEEIISRIVRNPQLAYKKIPSPATTVFDERYGTKLKRTARKRFNIIYGVGGGSVIDVAKYAAYKANIPFISVPTTLSNDGFASPFSVLRLYDDDGVRTLRANVPTGVVVNIGSITDGKKDSTLRRIQSGIGDLLSNIPANLDWDLAVQTSSGYPKERRVYRNDDAKSLAEAGPNLILGWLNYRRTDLFDKQFLYELAKGLMNSARSMQIEGSSRPASGFDHKFYHMYNKLTDFRPQATHGELVAVGALISTYAHDEYCEHDVKYFRMMKKAYERAGLPTTENELDKLGVSMGQITESIDMALTFRPERYTILDEIGPEKLNECAYEVFR